jgi:hypothetical protein
MTMLQRGSAERVAFSVPKQSYWGEEIAPIARNYIEKNYGADLASRVDFCETSGVSSTQQEAEALSACIREHRMENDCSCDFKRSKPSSGADLEKDFAQA